MKLLEDKGLKSFCFNSLHNLTNYKEIIKKEQSTALIKFFLSYFNFYEIKAYENKVSQGQVIGNKPPPPQKTSTQTEFISPLSYKVYFKS
eukprot:CAMPEP_0170531612 /NCGR_PEP_ID=MMETSP0209-20121228/63501_1 /TAXON_ID=665100 ORGANISM="Litonotus pictus, Strain P1" /NCGR_SAMPLE_ID=MMETSP0209 /ASSEMBLY_ACC=CAM_ASM_000301 /LENGTH=89 /DNA_ID=CAMNT_0010826493 /DNA_START=109 /DNA_END=375 /DNA_ORIENTATION=+